MGMYDSVMVKCQKCGEEHEFQSKSGECLLDVYTLENCPDDVMANVNRHSPYKCDCGTLFQVDIATRKPCTIHDVGSSFTKDEVINILQKRADNAFHKFHEYERNEILQAIDIITRLMPPSSFPDW
jgi:hypothetical protein